MRGLRPLLAATAITTALIWASPSTPAAHATSTTPLSTSAADDGSETITWMVRPSDGVVEDGRSWVELELDAGESVVEHLLVRNLSTETVSFRLSAADGYFTETGRFNMLTSGEESTGAGTWIDLQESVDVASGTDVIVPFTVTVPENAEPGDHAAGVAASVRSGSDAEVGIESRVGFRVMTRVSGDLDPAVTSTVTADYTGSINPFEPGTTHVAYEVTNSGNTRLAVDASITLAGPLGVLARSAGLESITEIAPGESRTMRHEISGVWPIGALTIDAEARAATIDGALTAPTSSATTVVPAVPWAQGVVGAAIIALVLAALADRRRRARRIAEMVDRARSEGRAEAGTAGAALVVAPLLIAAALVLTPATPPSATAGTSDRLDEQGITLHVDIAHQPDVAPTPGPEVALPATGGTDPGWLFLTALVLLGAGAASMAAVYRRVRTSRS